MNKRLLYFIFIILVSYLATFLRLLIDNIIIVSCIGSFLYGFIIDRGIKNSKKEILLTGFCSCLTSFSGVINFLYEVFLKKDYFELFFYLNLIVIFNLIVMYFGCLISRKLA